MEVSEEAIGRSRPCTECNQPIEITRENTKKSDEKSPYKKIGDLLIDEDLISQEQLEEALKRQSETGGKIVENLIELGSITVDQFISFLSNQPGVASLDLSNYHISPDVVALVDKELAVKNEVFPIDKMGKLLTLGMACPLDAATIKEIEQITGLRVKPILCSTGQITNAINRYYGGDADDSDDHKYQLEDSSPEKSPEKPPEAALANEEPVIESPKVIAEKVDTGLRLANISRLISELKDLPVLPDTVVQVKNAMEDLSIAPAEVARLIIQDPAVAAKVLSVANSASYGFPSRVDTVELAVALLGLRETYSIVLSAAVMNLFETNQRFNYKNYWEEAMNCAGAARIIAEACGKGKDKGIFTAGLLHDIGRIALLETVADMYVKVDPALADEELITAEQEFVGLTHTEAGFELASNWNLPESIAEVIRFHHQPDFSEKNAQNSAIVSLAEKWTREYLLGQDSKETLLEKSKPLIEVTGMNADAAAGVFDIVAGLEPVFFKWNDEESAA
jgi:HD-like signal output (HDOD) protein